MVVSENVKTDTVVHPADALASALDRANGLLIVLMDLYDARRETFAGGSPFIVHGMSTVSDLIDEARRALTELQDQYDLSLRAAPVAVVSVPQPALKPIAAAVVTLKEADQSSERMAKFSR